MKRRVIDSLQASLERVMRGKEPWIRIDSYGYGAVAWYLRPYVTEVSLDAADLGVQRPYAPPARAAACLAWAWAVTRFPVEPDQLPIILTWLENAGADMRAAVVATAEIDSAAAWDLVRVAMEG